MPSNLTRRETLVAGFGAALLASLPTPILALTDRQARVLVDTLVADINTVIASGKSLNAMIQDFERIFRRYGDVPLIARSALGPDARGLSSRQLAAYTDAFTGYISRKYGKRFREFIGGEIIVQTARKVKSFHEVRTTVKLRGEAPFEVNFLVSDKSGKDLFFDMIIEGISLRLSEKEEIGAMFDRNRGDISKLIADLNKAG